MSLLPNSPLLPVNPPPEEPNSRGLFPADGAERDAAELTETGTAKRVTLSAVADASGVSAGVVSSFFSGHYYAKDAQFRIGMSDQTQERIVAAARALGYQPPDLAWQVRLYPETGDFCYLLHAGVPDGIANQYFGRMLKGAVEGINDSARQLVFAPFDDRDYRAAPEQLPAAVRNGRASRFLLAGNPNRSLLTAITERGFAAVYLSRDVAMPGVCSVLPDFAEAARLGIGKLLASGHRRIAVGAESYFHAGDADVQERLRGIAEALGAAGIGFRAEDVIYNSGESGETGNAIVENLRRHSPRPTAVFCFDDLTALRVMEAARQVGWALPEELSVVGCNDDPRSAMAEPALTTVRLPAEEMGARAVRELQGMVRGQAMTERVVLPVTLVERGSVAFLEG